MPRGPGEIGPGLRLNETYEIVGLVGEGGLSQVYRAFNIRNRHPVAIKFLRANLIGDADSMELFQREASILAELSHDAIVRYLGFSFDPLIRREYLVMEFVEGVSLEARMRAKPLDAAEAMTLKTRLASGLYAAHRRGAVHRDMSPDNVILPGGEIENAKIIDFGIAKAMKFAEHTVIGSGLAGKFSYMSPEQVFGGGVAEKSDVYSLGLVLAAAVRGEPLDMGKTLAELAPKRSTTPDLSSVDASLRPLIARMLQPNPAERPAMDEVAAWAQPSKPAAAPKTPAPTGAAPATGSSRFGALAALLGALIIVASLGATGWVFRDDLRGLIAGAAPRPSPSSETETAPSPTQTPEVAAKTQTASPEPEPPAVTPSAVASPERTPSAAIPAPQPSAPVFSPSPTAVASPNAAEPSPTSTHADLAPSTKPTSFAAPTPVVASPARTTPAAPPTPLPSAPIFSPSPTAVASPNVAPAPPPSTASTHTEATPVVKPSPPEVAATPTPTTPAPTQTVAAMTPARAPPPKAPTILTTLDTAYVGRPFRQALPPFESDDPDGITIAPLGRVPPGLSVTDAGRGAAVIEGTPLHAGTSAFGIVATDRNKRSTTMHAIAIVVDAPPPTTSASAPVAIRSPEATATPTGAAPATPSPTVTASPSPTTIVSVAPVAPTATPKPAAPATQIAALSGDALSSLLKKYEGGDCWLARNAPSPSDAAHIEAVSADAARLDRFAAEAGAGVTLDRVTLDRSQCPALAIARGPDGGARLELTARDVGGAVPLAGVVRGLQGRPAVVLVVLDNGRTLSLKTAPESGDAARFSFEIAKVDDEDVGHRLVVAAVVSARPLPSLRESGADQPRPLLSLGPAADLFPKLSADAVAANASLDVRFVTLLRP